MCQRSYSVELLFFITVATQKPAAQISAVRYPAM
jgi:hypothetical protein